MTTGGPFFAFSRRVLIARSTSFSCGSREGCRSHRIPTLLAELHELLQLGVGLGDADVADDALAGLPSLAHGFDELDGLPGASRLGFGAEEHEAIPDSAFSEPLACLPGLRNIIILEALHFPLERDRAGIPLRATPRKAGTALKSSQTVEVRKRVDGARCLNHDLSNSCDSLQTHHWRKIGGCIVWPELATRNGGVGNVRRHGCMATCRHCPRPRVRPDGFLFRLTAIAGLA